jgi:predicted anti-sigma-YlaC factor YlaD
MWFFSRNPGACRAFEASLEEHLEALDTAPGARPGPALAEHLGTCATCREALDAAREVGTLVREGAMRVPESLANDPFFAVRVGARIRENMGRSGEFWPQLETVSLRFMAYALSLAVLLGALSASGVTRTSPSRDFGTARLRPADPRAISPESNPAPVNPDEVVVALLSSERGRQR